LFGGANVAYSLAKDGILPEVFERKVWFKSIEGLYFTAGLSLVFALFFNLGAIASITSTVFTVIYIFVLISHIKIHKEYGGVFPNLAKRAHAENLPSLLKKTLEESGLALSGDISQEIKSCSSQIGEILQREPTMHAEIIKMIGMG